MKLTTICSSLGLVFWFVKTGGGSDVCLVVAVMPVLSLLVLLL